MGAAWDEASGQVLDDTLEEFGDPVTYVPAAGEPFELAGGGVFSDRWEGVDPDTGATISSTQPNLVVRRSEWPDSWTTADRVQVRGDTYEPRDVQPDGNPDAARIFLHLVTS